ncbi:MAG TPA: 1-deoxy-D-xylulose-5-phosphate reductoisomerase [Dehalococcoidia bacterium]|nr:1-deoxy-D-xylulose-5-phosphate reductoisomerase [Dehalococcoidia bacterium]
MKRLALIGSTGSIGCQTLEIVRAHPDEFRVTVLAAGRRVADLAAQALEFAPDLVALPDAAGQAAFCGLANFPADRVVSGDDALARAVREADADVVIVATPGSAGLRPTLAAIDRGLPVALANKEVLVTAGQIVLDALARRGTFLLPIDSEHSALWQCLRGESTDGSLTDRAAAAPARADWVSRLILTASGGPFRDRPAADLAGVSPAEALAHPNWVMGPKVTIDSATLLNKGFEVIEAHWLFGVPYDVIEVIMHRESIVHSLVEFVDGSTKAQLSVPDMRPAIQYALTYPDRAPNALTPRLDLAVLGALRFDPIPWEKFPCLSLAIEAGRRGGTYPAVLNAADEVAVESFLQGTIRLADIPSIIESALTAHRPSPADYESIVEADQWARQQALTWIESFSSSPR